MNITITQDNSRVEQLGSNSASIVEKLYELATDPNNTLTLEGNISGNSAYADQVTYLTTNYPDLIINATKLYMTFRDPHVVSALLSQGVGDGTGITMSDLDGLQINGNGGLGKITFKNNTDIEYFEEFKYFTNQIDGNNGPFGNCTNLKLIGFSTDYNCSGDGYFENVYCDIVIPSLKWYLEYNVGRRWRFPATGNWDINVLDWHDIYIGNTNNKLENPVVTSDINVSYYARLNYTKIKTLTWESNSNIPDSFCNLCKQLTSVAITGQNIEIGNEAFVECTSLLTITGLSSIIKFYDKSFRLCTSLSADVSQLSNATSIGHLAFAGCSNITGTLNLPNLAFLGDRSFSETGITSIQNLGSVTNILEACFNGCTHLTSVVFPLNLTSIENGAFANCNKLILDVSTLPSSITTIGSEAFVNCANVTGTLNLPNLTNITGIAFKNTNITSISNLGSITTLSGGTFYGCRNLTSVLLPSTLTTIDVEVFNDTAITRLLIPEGVTTIQDSSFLNCSPNISYVELPSTISNINFLFHRMFDAVSASNSVVVVIKATTPPQARYYASWAVDSTNVTKCRGIYVPDASVSAYTSITDSDNPWSHSDVKAKVYPISLLLTDSPSAWLIYNRS